MNEFVEIPANKRSLFMRKPVHGIGINDAKYLIEYFRDSVRYRCPYYATWNRMIARCYSKLYLTKNPTYLGCSVHPDWLVFSIFKEWMMAQDWQNNALDKDLLIPGNKVYSKDTCIFVPTEINAILRKQNKGKHLLGVSWVKEKNKFKAECSINDATTFLGYFHSELDAHNCYINFKKELLLNIAATQTNLKIRECLINLSNSLTNFITNK